MSWSGVLLGTVRPTEKDGLVLYFILYMYHVVNLGCVASDI